MYSVAAFSIGRVISHKSSFLVNTKDKKHAKQVSAHLAMFFHYNLTELSALYHFFSVFKRS